MTRFQSTNERIGKMRSLCAAGMAVAAVCVSQTAKAELFDLSYHGGVLSSNYAGFNNLPLIGDIIIDLPTQTQFTNPRGTFTLQGFYGVADPSWIQSYTFSVGSEVISSSQENPSANSIVAFTTISLNFFDSELRSWDIDVVHDQGGGGGRFGGNPLPFESLEFATRGGCEALGEPSCDYELAKDSDGHVGTIRANRFGSPYSGSWTMTPVTDPPVTTTPLPASWALVGGGLALIGAARRWRRGHSYS